MNVTFVVSWYDRNGQRQAEFDNFDRAHARLLNLWADGYPSAVLNMRTISYNSGSSR